MISFFSRDLAWVVRYCQKVTNQEYNLTQVETLRIEEKECCSDRFACSCVREMGNVQPDESFQGKVLQFASECDQEVNKRCGIVHTDLLKHHCPATALKAMVKHKQVLTIVCLGGFLFLTILGLGLCYVQNKRWAPSGAAVFRKPMITQGQAVRLAQVVIDDDDDDNEREPNQQQPDKPLSAVVVDENGAPHVCCCSECICHDEKDRQNPVSQVAPSEGGEVNLQSMPEPSVITDYAQNHETKQFSNSALAKAGQ